MAKSRLTRRAVRPEGVNENANGVDTAHQSGAEPGESPTRKQSQARLRSESRMPAADRTKDDGADKPDAVRTDRAKSWAGPGTFAHRITDLATNPAHSTWLIPALIAFDLVLSAGIIWKVPYTEIDWKTYMEQVRQVFYDGERNYSNIAGPTGPLVYPAGHVVLYGILYRLTSAGTNILLGQIIFGGIYLTGLWLTMKVYETAKAPPYLFTLLVLSRRLHSIFMLRMFNDGFVAVFLMATVLALQHRRQGWAGLFMSLALATKMSALLVVPAVASVVLTNHGWDRLVSFGLMVVMVHSLVGVTFLSAYPMSYLTGAFNLGRAFLYEWTVNWRFVDEKTFGSIAFSAGLAALHLGLLAGFVVYRWLGAITAPSSWIRIQADSLAFRGLQQLPPAESKTEFKTRWDVIKFMILNPTTIASGLTDQLASSPIEYPVTAVFAANAVGMLAARSLHYQFYAWLCWTTPFLLWRAVDRPAVRSHLWPVKAAAILAVCGAQEWAWNVFPSTPVSSAVVVGALAMQVGAAWFGSQAETEKLALEYRRP